MCCNHPACGGAGRGCGGGDNGAGWRSTMRQVNQSNGLHVHDQSGQRKPRIALYSHDTQGLGHIRRNLLLASVFRRMGTDPIVLMLSGARELGSFALPPGVDCVTLPALAKDVHGRYGSRSLEVSLDDVVDIRSRVFRAALESFAPDVFIVDKAPRGALNELDTVLRSLRDTGRTRMVLGLREILDDSESVEREWREGAFEDVVREYYDRVWIYGDQSVFDTLGEYGLSDEVRRKSRFTGYLDPRDCWLPTTPREAPIVQPEDIPPPPFVLCEVGGGQDGAPLARAFLDTPLPRCWNGVLVTGPQMPIAQREEFKRRAAGRTDMRVLEFVTDCRPLLERADRVICMGGYNTVCEVMAYGKAALVIPRTVPRTEQLIRAERLARMGFLDMLTPDCLSPAALTAWLAGPEPANARDAARRIDMRGTQRLPGLLREVMDARPEVRHALA